MDLAKRQAAVFDASAQDLAAAVGARIDGLTSWRARYWAPLVLGLIMMGDSWDSIVIAYVMPAMRQTWGLDPVAIGAAISAGYGGQLVGSLALGPAAEKFGRLPVFNFAILTMCALSLGCALTPDVRVFFAFRFLEGFALGGAMPACISYVNELAPTATRGRYFSIFQFIMVSGYSLASLAAPFVIPAWGWRAMFVLGALPALCVPLVMATLPESPRWLARCGRVAAVNKALARLGAAPVGEGLKVVRGQAARVPVVALFAPEYRARTVMIGVMWFCTSLVSFGFATWVPTLYVQVFHVSQQDALRYAAIAGGVYLFVPLVFAAILDVFGRRRPAILSCVLALAALVALMVVDPARTPLVVVLITTGWVAAAAAFIVMWPYTAEVFPTHVRATGLGLASSLARGASMLTPVMVGGILAVTGSIRGVFALMAAGMILTTALWVLFARETARLSLEETAGE